MQIEYKGVCYSIYRGAFYQALSDTKRQWLSDGMVVVGATGVIVAIGDASEVAPNYGLDLEQVARAEGLFLPAFYDLHFHWVQDAVRAMPKTSLIEWLERYTFPMEAKFADVNYARERAAFFWKRILATGTIGGLCYSSIHEVALEAALEYAPEGFKVGNVLMTMECPEYLRQSEAEAIASVQSCAQRFGTRYVSSPRFAPTTGPAVMQAAAEAARAHGCFQQTHLDETLPEIEWVLGIYRNLPGFEDVATYTEIYDRVGMLGPQTVFGHCLHLDASEWQLLAESDSVIASCPTSNAPLELLGLGSGLYDFQQAEAYGVRWALASDIGGGPFLSMLDVMASFIEQNETAGVAVTANKALYRSTLAGAESLGLAETKGHWAVGCDFDCVRVPLPMGLLESNDPEQMLRKLILNVTERADYETLVWETIIANESRFCRSDIRSIVVTT